MFNEVQGMEEINDIGPIKIKVMSHFRFSICDTTFFTEYTKDGVVNQVKIPQKLKFISYADSLNKPAAVGSLMISDYEKIGRSEQLHLAFLAIRAFQDKNNGALPELLNISHSDQVIEFAKRINASGKNDNCFSVENIEEDIIRKVSLYARAQVSPIASF